MVLDTLKKASDWTNKVATVIMLIYIIAVTVLAFVGVVYRAFGNALSWNEELMRWILVGIAYIGGSVALKEQSHIGVVYFVSKMPKSWKKTAIIIGYAAIILFLLIVVIYGWQAAFRARRQLGAIVRISTMYTKFNIPIGAAFMLVHMIYFSVGLLMGKGEPQEYMVSGGDTA
jgi:TRAP-type C4-dicarboxylate transport system permease small subunit